MVYFFYSNTVVIEILGNKLHRKIKFCENLTVIYVFSRSHLLIEIVNIDRLRRYGRLFSLKIILLYKNIQ